MKLFSADRSRRSSPTPSSITLFPLVPVLPLAQGKDPYSLLMRSCWMFGTFYLPLRRLLPAAIEGSYMSSCMACFYCRGEPFPCTVSFKVPKFQRPDYGEILDQFFKVTLFRRSLLDPLPVGFIYLEPYFAMSHYWVDVRLSGGFAYFVVFPRPLSGRSLLPVVVFSPGVGEKWLCGGFILPHGGHAT